MFAGSGEAGLARQDRRGLAFDPQVAKREPRVPDEHPGPRLAHHHLDGRALVRTVAVNGAGAAGCLSWTERTVGKSISGVTCEGCTVLTDCAARAVMVFATIEPQHRVDRLQVASDVDRQLRPVRCRTHCRPHAAQVCKRTASPRPAFRTGFSHRSRCRVGNLPLSPRGRQGKLPAMGRPQRRAAPGRQAPFALYCLHGRSRAHGARDLQVPPDGRMLRCRLARSRRS